MLQLKAAKLEIRDLQAEFEVERDDYLVTIRRLEREGQLLHSLLERMVPLVRRDCNYSNLDRLKKEAVWDDEITTWRLPDVMVQKTTLPSGGMQEQACIKLDIFCFHILCSLNIILPSFSLTAVASKPAAHKGSSAEPREQSTVCQRNNARSYTYWNTE